jgi:hypothetical protein
MNMMLMPPKQCPECGKLFSTEIGARGLRGLCRVCSHKKMGFPSRRVLEKPELGDD